jgi:peptide deformylase
MSELSIITLDSELLSLNFKETVLRNRASEVPVKEGRYLELCRKIALDMFEVMYSVYGAALAAPQVGISLRLIVLDPARVDFGPHVLINPVVTFQNEFEEAAIESCLSLPNYSGKVYRSTRISISTYNLSGQKEAFDVDGLLARIFQHELDHLDGILYCDHLRQGDRLEKSDRAARRKAVEAITNL